MPLRKSPIRTPALLAANRANARKSTGPRTQKGKDRIALNALKHGRYSKAFRQKLEQARGRESVGLFEWIHSHISDLLDPVEPSERLQAERLAREVYCLAWLAHQPPKRLPRGPGTKPESAVNSPHRRFTFRSRIRIVNTRTGARLAFWVRRPRRRTASLRLPVTANPEIAAWFLCEQPELVGDVAGGTLHKDRPRHMLAVYHPPPQTPCYNPHLAVERRIDDRSPTGERPISPAGT